MYLEIIGTQVRLAGSMHLWPVEVGSTALPAWVWRAYEWCQQLLLESDHKDAAQFMRLTDGSTLKNLLAPSTWSALDKELPPGVDFSALKPWAALINLQFMGKTMLPGVELQFTSRAGEDGKPIVYLETSAEFAARADGAQPSDYAEAFARVLGNLHAFQQVLHDMHGAWLTGHIEAVEAILPRTLLGLPVVAKLLLDDRNEAWLPKILTATERLERTLVVVGAAHLPGEQGLVARLRRVGRDVRLIPAS